MSINSKSRKEDIYTAYKEMKAELDSNSGVSLQDRVLKQTTAKVKEQQPYTVQSLENAKNILDEMLNVYGELDKVNNVIGVRKQELKELTDIEHEVNTLEALQKANEKARLEHNDKMKMLSQSYQDKTFELNKEYSRRNDDLIYDMEQLKKAKNNEISEMIKKRMDSLKEEESKFIKRVSEFEAEKYNVEDLKAEIQALTDTKQAEIKKAVDKEKAILSNVLTKDFEHKLKVAELEADSKVQLLESQVKSLQDTLTARNFENKELNEKLSESYNRIQKVISEALESNSSKSQNESFKQLIRDMKKSD